jgi:hypothetical protein
MNHLFPDCKIHTMPQRSPEWHAIRKDKLTASGMGAWLAERPECRMTIPELRTELVDRCIAHKSSAKRDELIELCIASGIDLPAQHLKGTVDARHTAICRILGAMSNCAVPDQWEVDPDGPPPRNPALWAVWNGIRQEAAAVKSFEEWSGETIIEVGFCEHKSGVAGCSPDGLIDGKPYGFEGKAPLPTTHVRYLLDGVLPAEYVDQVHASMAITGAQGWHFQSYCPGLPPFRIFTPRDEYTERMVAGLVEFSVHLESARDEIAALWDAEFTKEGEQ